MNHRELAWCGDASGGGGGGGGKELRAPRKLDVTWDIQKGSGTVHCIYGPVCFGSSPGIMTHALASAAASIRVPNLIASQP